MHFDFADVLLEVMNRKASDLHITAGVPVTVSRMTDGVSQATTLERVLPGTATASQSTVARATLRNDDGQWRPGAAVKARIVVATTPAAQAT